MFFKRLHRLFCMMTCLTLCGSYVSNGHVQPASMDSLLNVLDECIANRTTYEKQFIQRMDQLRSKAETTTDKKEALNLWIKIAQEEFYHSSRLSLEAIRKGTPIAQSLHDKEAEFILSSIKANVYGNIGLPWDGERLLLSMDIRSLSSEARNQYFLTLNDIYGFYQQGNLPNEIVNIKSNEIRFTEDSIKRFFRKYHRTGHTSAA